MRESDEKQSTEKPGDARETQEPEEGRSRWRGALGSARRGILSSGEMLSDAAEATRQGIQRSGEVIADATPGAAGATKRGAIRTGEVLSGADIRRFDEFAEAVTRVAVGLHHDQTDVRERIAWLELEAAEIRRFQAELAERLAFIERMYAFHQDKGNRE